MTKTIFVNRNAGAIEWAQCQNLPNLEVVADFDPSKVQAGDTVIGTLPLALIADANARGATFQTLAMEVPAELRGKPISADQMETLGAKLVPLHVERKRPEIGTDAVMVTRHSGALEWLKRQGFEQAKVTPHFTEADVAKVTADTTIIGVLPPDVVRRIQEKGGNFVGLEMEFRDGDHKADLTADEMTTRNAKLTGFHVTMGAEADKGHIPAGADVAVAGQSPATARSHKV